VSSDFLFALVGDRREDSFPKPLLPPHLFSALLLRSTRGPLRQLCRSSPPATVSSRKPSEQSLVPHAATTASLRMSPLCALRGLVFQIGPVKGFNLFFPFLPPPRLSRAYSEKVCDEQFLSCHLGTCFVLPLGLILSPNDFPTPFPQKTPSCSGFS